MIARASDGIIAGVCGGLAKRLDLEPWLVRFLFVCSIIFFGTGIFLYLLLTLSLPREDRIAQAYEKRIMGVCANIARRSELDVGLTRFLALILLFMSFGWGAVFAYVVLYFALPTQQESLPTATAGTQLPTSANPEPSRTESSNS